MDSLTSAVSDKNASAGVGCDTTQQGEGETLWRAGDQRRTI